VIASNVSVAAPCRLHFGLLYVPVVNHDHNQPESEPVNQLEQSPVNQLENQAKNQPVSDASVRKFGGIGLMIKSQNLGINVQICDHDRWQFEGDYVHRLPKIVDHITNHTSADIKLKQPQRIIATGPPEHVGLGIGTALSLAVAEAIRVRSENANRSTEFLAELSGRGERSGIGIHGFRNGGFVLDEGKLDGEKISRCRAIAVPQAWRVLVLRPRTEVRWSGVSERAAFSRSRVLETAIEVRNQLAGILENELLPALEKSLNFEHFCDALGRYNYLAGTPFLSDQGQIYSSNEVAELVCFLKTIGLHGVGQSSWGPTVFAMVSSDQEAVQAADKIQTEWRDKLETLEIATVSGPAQTL
jgi:beta-ribofuranosylaminobenzene 5'-phosphate synthase